MPEATLRVPIHDLPLVARPGIVEVLDVVGDDVDRGGFFLGDEVGEDGADDRSHAAAEGTVKRRATGGTWVTYEETMITGTLFSLHQR